MYNKTTAVDPNNVRALPLVFIVLAMAVRLAPENWAGDDHTRKISSLRMYWSCELVHSRSQLTSARRSILIATAIQSESMELVLTRLLVCRLLWIFLMTVRDVPRANPRPPPDRVLVAARRVPAYRASNRVASRRNEDGSRVRAASSSLTKLTGSPFQTEYRRRCWSYLYHADRLYSLILGRPPSISDAYTDAL